MADLIDRQALIKRLKVWDTPDVTDKMLYNFALNRALEMPTIEAVPVKHGRWIEDEYGILRCSECQPGKVYKTNYCPNCGAKMDGVENGRQTYKCKQVCRRYL